MKKSQKIYYFCMMIIVCLTLSTGCKKDNKTKVIQQFIRTQINDETCLLSYEAPTEAKNRFLEYFTEEGYEDYLDEAFGYLYPQLFYAYNIETFDVQHINSKKLREIENQVIYECEVKYNVHLKKEKEKSKAESIEMIDYLQVTIDQHNKITNVIVLNTSDIIKKLILDVKVQ